MILAKTVLPVVEAVEYAGTIFRSLEKWDRLELSSTLEDGKEKRMKSYTVYFDGTEIGTLYDDEENQKHKYIPTDDAVRIKDSLILKELWQPTDGFSDPIPFFKNRIANCARFGFGEQVGDVIGYQTDHYRLVRIS